MSTYTLREMQGFWAYLSLLVDLCNKEIEGGYDDVRADSMPCPMCARTIPAGSIPRQLKETEHAMCPACVRLRQVSGPLAKRIHGDGAHQIVRGGDLSAEIRKNVEKRRAATPAKTPMEKGARLKKMIHDMQASMKTMEPDERARTQRIIDAAENGYRRLTGEQA